MVVMQSLSIKKLTAVVVVVVVNDKLNLDLSAVVCCCEKTTKRNWLDGPLVVVVSVRPCPFV